MKTSKELIGHVKIGKRSYSWYDVCSLEGNTYMYRLKQDEYPHETAAEISLPIHRSSVPWSVRIFDGGRMSFEHLSDVLKDVEKYVLESEETFEKRRSEFTDTILSHFKSEG